MPRRIPKTNRHRKLKSVDPDSRGGSERGRKNNKVNMPPNDEQDSHRIQEFIRLKNLAKENKLKRKRKKKRNDYITVTSDTKHPHIPERMTQREFETEEHFLWRIQRLTNEAMAEAKVEEKFGIDNSKVLPETKITTNKQMKRKIAKQKRKEKKKQKLQNKIDEFSQFSDVVTFGEIVTRPPKLVFPKKAEKLKTLYTAKLK